VTRRKNDSVQVDIRVNVCPELEHRLEQLGLSIEDVLLGLAQLASAKSSDAGNDRDFEDKKPGYTIVTRF